MAARVRCRTQLYEPSERSAALGPCHMLLQDAEQKVCSLGAIAYEHGSFALMSWYGICFWHCTELWAATGVAAARIDMPTAVSSGCMQIGELSAFHIRSFSSRS